MLGYDYPVMGFFWTVVVFFLWIAWIFWLFRVFGDIFQSDDMGGFAKAMWSIFVVVLPILGVLVYMIARGNKMAERSLRDAQAQEAEFRSYVQETAGSASGTADELAKLVDLKSQGIISDAEFAQQKSKLLA
jgi:ABC-type multidrug transport system fused ATPase/permease subunit